MAGFNSKSCYRVSSFFSVMFPSRISWTIYIEMEAESNTSDKTVNTEINNLHLKENSFTNPFEVNIIERLKREFTLLWINTRELKINY